MAGDPYWNNVVLLLGFEGTNGATGAPGFTDESSAAHGTGSVVSATIDTSQSKFGNSSALFSSIAPTVSFANHADWKFGSGAFTIEGWYRPNNATAASTILSLWGAGALSWLLYGAIGGDNKLHWSTSTDGSSVNNDITGSTSLTSNAAFYAWAVDFDGSKYRLYLDGVMDGSFSTPRTLFSPTTSLTMGTSNSGGNTLAGWLDEIRITKGVARYANDSGYTVSTSAFPRGPVGTFTTTYTYQQSIILDRSSNPGPEATAFLARTSGIDTTHTNAYSDLINGLVTDGVWTKLDVLQIYAAQNSTVAVLNLVSASFPAVANGGITFTADRGFTGSGSDGSKYIDSGFNASTAGGQYTQNSAHISAWCLNEPSSGDPIMGVVSGSGETMIRPRNASNGNVFEIRVNSTGINTVAIGTAVGHSLANRSASNAVQGYRDGSSLITGSTASVTMVNTNFDVIGEHNSSGSHGGSGHQVAMASFGSSLSSTDVTNLYNRLRTYLTAVGVP